MYSLNPFFRLKLDQWSRLSFSASCFHVVFVLLLFISQASLALDLTLPDRLATPSRHFSKIDKTPFLALENIKDRILAVGDRGVIAYTDDQGESWQQAQVPVSSLLTAVDFPNDTDGWAVGHAGVILHSQDRGETWKLQFDGNKINQMRLELAQEKVTLAKSDLETAEEGEEQDLQYALEDAEFALTNAQFDVDLGPANPLLDVLFIDDKKGFAVGAYGLFLMTEDGGAKWQTIADRLENFDRYHLNTIERLKGGAIIIAGEAGTLFASYDDGEQWETLFGPYQGSFFGIQATNNEEEALLYGLKGHIFKTEDAGQKWTRVSVDAETSLTSSCLSMEGRMVIAGFSGVVLMSHDQGTSFTRIKTKGFEGFNAVTFTEDNTLLLVSDEGIQRLKVE